MLYFEYLPEELNYVISSYIEYDDLENLEDVLYVNYEKLFAINYPKDYKDVKEIFSVDETIKKYKNKWDILYRDIILRKKYYNPFDINFLLYNSISNNIHYTILIYKNYNEFFKYKKFLYDKGLKSDYLSYYIYKMINDLKMEIVDNLYENFKQFSYQDLNNIYSTSVITYAMIFLLHVNNPNFGASIDDLSQYLEGIYMKYDDVSLDYGTTLILLFSDEIMNFINKINKQ